MESPLGAIASADIPDTPAELADRARRVVAANSHDAADARELLAMLGLIDQPETAAAETTTPPARAPLASHCRTCGRYLVPKSQKPLAGEARRGPNGLCETHYKAEWRAAKASA
ncbi:hypothetical protein DW322_11130 [Rhodococcus rhodnii]|uniref:Uncharacterized protein n=2 Tax=Rhodococcus rhodnii TaxID=38312 RepID=R7WRX6_9NOCA|nr:hypothetical protein [Rhodococcus rhodnii]EOM78035.1 hypothetical protein Rrhod_0576 [Rhodococcus rhodnii LMG 5362]TXG90664.1 hypothetical protein DW322_11130 [Rhodococcus rhodnii]